MSKLTDEIRKHVQWPDTNQAQMMGNALLKAVEVLEESASVGCHIQSEPKCIDQGMRREEMCRPCRAADTLAAIAADLGIEGDDDE